MKVLFINKFLGKYEFYREPLGIISLASAINHKHKVSIVDPIKENLHKKITEFKPDVIAYSIRTGFHRYYIDLNTKLKSKYNFFSVFGGPHATFFPDMINQDGVDCVCRGEAEGAFLELLDALEKKRDITKIKNFWIKKNGKIYKNECRALVQNLDGLKFPDRSLFGNHKEIKESKIKSFITGRGCPFNCPYCFNKGLKKMYSNQNYVRRRSVKNVIREIKEVKKNYNLKIVIFEDDTFNLGKEWLREFSKEFKKLNLKCFCKGIRVDLFDEETAKLLKEANCYRVTFGLESGSEKIRKNILNRNMSNEQIIRCAMLLRKYGIRFLTENILGIPGSSLEDDLETLRLNLICKPTYGHANIMQPYPGTEIHEIAVKNKLCKKLIFDELGSLNDVSNLKINNKLERENLQKLFAPTVKFPFIYPHIRWLIKLRLGFIYSLIYHFVKAYEVYKCYHILPKLHLLVARQYSI